MKTTTATSSLPISGRYSSRSMPPQPIWSLPRRPSMAWYEREKPPTPFPSCASHENNPFAKTGSGQRYDTLKPSAVFAGAWRRYAPITAGFCAAWLCDLPQGAGSLRKNGPFVEFSLCLSRACIYVNVSKRPFLLTVRRFVKRHVSIETDRLSRLTWDKRKEDLLLFQRRSRTYLQWVASSRSSL